jgi:hypothetical protein
VLIRSQKGNLSKEKAVQLIIDTLNPNNDVGEIGMLIVSKSKYNSLLKIFKDTEVDLKNEKLRTEYWKGEYIKKGNEVGSFSDKLRKKEMEADSLRNDNNELNRKVNELKNGLAAEKQIIFGLDKDLAATMEANQNLAKTIEELEQKETDAEARIDKLIVLIRSQKGNLSKEKAVQLIIDTLNPNNDVGEADCIPDEENYPEDDSLPCEPETLPMAPPEPLHPWLLEYEKAIDHTVEMINAGDDLETSIAALGEQIRKGHKAKALSQKFYDILHCEVIKRLI